MWQLLPEAKVDCISEAAQLAIGDFRDELGLVILLNPDPMELRLPVFTGDGSYTLVRTSRLWQRLALDELKQSQLPR